MSTITSWHQIQSQLRNPNNPVVFFEMAVGPTQIGRIMMELYADTTPKTAENFRALCTGKLNIYRFFRWMTTRCPV